MRSAVVYTDSREACVKESGDIVLSEVVLSLYSVSLYLLILLVFHISDSATCQCMYTFVFDGCE